MISTYKSGDTENVSFIPIKDIEFTTPMIDMLNELNQRPEYKKYRNKNYDIIKKDREETFKLTRIESVIDGFKKNKSLPPVKLKIHESKVVVGEFTVQKYVPPSLRKEKPPEFFKFKKEVTKVSYSVEDGRHRVVASIFLGLTHIPAKIIK